MDGLHRFLKDMGVGAPSKGLKALSVSWSRKLMAEMETHREPLAFAGAVVWLGKY